MTKKLTVLLKYFSFCVIFFLLSKVMFMSGNYGQNSLLTVGENGGIFWMDLKINVSTTCYLLLLAALLSGFNLLLKAVFVNSFVYINSLIVLIFDSLSTFFDLGFYLYLDTRLKIRVFNYFKDPFAIGASEYFLNVFFQCIHPSVVR